MALSGNKGEWSEIYALFKLLSEGKVHAGDAEMNKMDLFYPIIDIIREESKRYEYLPNVNQNIIIIHENGEEYGRISMDKFFLESKNLLNIISKANDRAFEIPSTELFMNQIGCSKLKAPSKDKADIHIIIHDLHTNMQPLLGFSIKSQLGSASTLLNAGITTNFTFKITGKDLSDNDIANINNIYEHLPRMESIIKHGCKLEFVDVEHQTFKNNLLFLDCCMPEFLALCLLADSMPNSTSSIKDIVKIVSTTNPFHFTGNDIESFYEHKMKVLLIDAALGMTPAKEWKGKYDANGGYLVVKNDGEIVCYHFYNRNDIEDYLFNNTRFERASRSRYHFGTLYRGTDNCVYLKLNLQIRFKK